MWQRKSREELEEQKIRHRRNPIPPLVIGGLGAICGLICEPSLTVVLSFFGACFALAYLGQILFGNIFMFIFGIFGGPIPAGENPTVICNNCHQIKTRDEALACGCGGTFEPFENWKWVTDETV